MKKTGLKKSEYVWKKNMSAREVISMLKHNDWDFIRQRGSHILYKKNGIICTIPNHSVLATGTIKSIEKIVNLAERKKQDEISIQTRFIPTGNDNNGYSM